MGHLKQNVVSISWDRQGEVSSSPPHGESSASMVGKIILGRLWEMSRLRRVSVEP